MAPDVLFGAPTEHEAETRYEEYSQKIGSSPDRDGLLLHVLEAGLLRAEVGHDEYVHARPEHLGRVSSIYLRASDPESHEMLAGAVDALDLAGLASVAGEAQAAFQLLQLEAGRVPLLAADQEPARVDDGEDHILLADVTELVVMGRREVEQMPAACDDRVEAFAAKYVSRPHGP